MFHAHTHTYVVNGHAYTFYDTLIKYINGCILTIYFFSNTYTKHAQIAFGHHVPLFQQQKSTRSAKDTYEYDVYDIKYIKQTFKHLERTKKETILTFVLLQI